MDSPRTRLTSKYGSLKSGRAAEVDVTRPGLKRQQKVERVSAGRADVVEAKLEA